MLRFSNLVCLGLAVSTLAERVSCDAARFEQPEKTLGWVQPGCCPHGCHKVRWLAAVARQKPKMLIKRRSAGAEFEGCTLLAGVSTRWGFEGSAGLDVAADHAAGQSGCLGAKAAVEGLNSEIGRAHV